MANTGGGVRWVEKVYTIQYKFNRFDTYHTWGHKEHNMREVQTDCTPCIHNIEDDPLLGLQCTGLTINIQI